MKKRIFCEERDACAIIAYVDKEGRSNHANIVETIESLKKMGHRSGDINGEGDGCGISADIPKEIWATRLAGAGLSPHLAESRSFFVGHFLLPAPSLHDKNNILAKVREILKNSGAEILLEHTEGVRNEELGPRARFDAPFFWQIAGMIPDKDTKASSKRLFSTQMKIEAAIPSIHIASLSHHTVVFKVQGVPELLPRVYPELFDENMKSVMVLGHGRYSTNTLPTVERSQPFSLLGHNGEINTIERLRSTGRTLGIQPVPGGSDSQDLNRVIEGLINLYDLSLLEAMEMVFPTIYSEVDKYNDALRNLYAFYRFFFPCSAQGPAAVLSRSGDTLMGSVDALGLRPLWFGESDYSYYLSSEKGVVSLERTMSDPRPLAPGEKIAIMGGRGRQAEVIDFEGIQKKLVALMSGRRGSRKYLNSFYRDIPSLKNTVHNDSEENKGKKPRTAFSQSAGHQLNLQSAFGWSHYDVSLRQRVSQTGREVIGSMGHTGPLAAFVPDSLPNLADYCKENVAVVTNPAIDREREAEHFSTRIALGNRPDIFGNKAETPLGLELHSPLLLGHGDIGVELDQEECREIAREFHSCLFDDVVDFFSYQQKDLRRVSVLDATFNPQASLRDRLEELGSEALRAIEKGAYLLILDDAASFSDGKVYVDPALATAFLNEFLIKQGKRREASLIVRSGAIRNLHDIMLLIGLGADALNPYLLWQVSCSYADDKRGPKEVLRNTFSVLHRGMEKVMSTMGIHEICGYGRIFSAIGLSDEVAAISRIPNFCSSKDRGLTFSLFEKLARKRLQKALAAKEEKIHKERLKNPKIGKILRNTAIGKTGYLEMAEELEKISEDMPSGIRHLMRPRPLTNTRKPHMDEVDISIGEHDMPLVIAAMSFGSQGESSFRAYAEAAKRVNIVCMNGEGGEIPDMLGQYRKNRGQQIASGRFGVYLGFLNSANFLEIKIGQGAKPGEGGHLPGTKVSEMVSKARHCTPGITLISPSNHHDIYSIEDLAQIVTELKTANPHAKVSVKIPVTSGVGTIAVGIAKAGADIVNLSGFEGGTGAAREHAKRFVGLPVEIGVSQAHQALVESCLRDKIEIWADGGLRSGHDVLKMILLGANRVGLGTLALMGVGCISCKRCHLDTCPKGISTQLRTVEDARARGVKVFQPRIFEEEAENLARLLGAIGEELKMRVSEIGATSLQDLVGRTELLEQYKLHEQLDIASVLEKTEHPCDPMKYPRPRIVRKPLSYMTRMISDLSMERFANNEKNVNFVEERVQSSDRAVGTYLAGAMERKFGPASDHKAFLRLDSSVPGNGLCAFMSPNLELMVEGGSQDGAAKGSFGGRLGVFRGRNILGHRIDGSAGKSFAYGAIGGLLMVQNMADSRACIRLSGADVVFGGRITEPLCDEKGNIASRAHLKGFAFEYMTGGRAVVLGDPGPWICAGMTGGVIYQCLYPELGFDKKALQIRLARGANVVIKKITTEGIEDVRTLLEPYIEELKKNYQDSEAQKVGEIQEGIEKRFVMIVPKPVRQLSAE